MPRKNSHFGINPHRPNPAPVGRPQKSQEELEREENHRLAAENYARRGVERVYQEQAKKKRASGDEVKLSKDQLEQYHKSWQTYWNQYYHQYYSDYYGKYYGEVKSGVENFHQESNKKLSEMFNDNKVLAEQKMRLEDPEAIRRDLLNRIVERGKESTFWGKVRHHVRALILAGTAGMIVLFIQFNPVVVGAVKQYLGPSSSASLPSIIEPSSSSSVSPDPMVIIPKIGVKTPVVYDEPSPYNDKVQKALERGVIRYWNSSSPGEDGNVVILGHSSNNLLNSGNYKYVFVNLRRLEMDDVIYLDYKNVRYAYKVTLKEVVESTNFEYIKPTPVPSVTLITCDPPGTDEKRLYVRAEQISPDPATNKKVNRDEDQPEVNEIPSSAPSFWGSIF
jgi:LPXTG-site transpeptidase (sortase) family protein